MHLAGLNITSFLLTLSSYHFSIQRMVVFAPSVAAIYVFTTMAEYLHLIHRQPFTRIVQTCRDVAKVKNVSWMKDLVQPFTKSVVFPPLFAFTGLLLALTGLWLFLYRRRGGWAGTFDGKGGQNGDKPRSGIRAAPLQIGIYSKSERVVGVCIILASMSLAGMAISLMEIIMRYRRTMILISDGKTGENFWGVGQIGALFTWAPLLVEMSYTAIYGCKA